MAHSKLNRLQIVMLVVLSIFVVRATAGDVIHGFVDGMVAGFTNGV